MSVRLAGTRISLEITQPKIMKLFLRADSNSITRKVPSTCTKTSLGYQGPLWNRFLPGRPIVNSKASRMATG